MGKSISSIIRVSLFGAPKAESQEGLKDTVILTSEFKAVKDKPDTDLALGYWKATSYEQVAEKFGSESKTAKAAQAFFSAPTHQPYVIISGYDVTKTVLANFTEMIALYKNWYHACIADDLAFFDMTPAGPKLFEAASAIEAMEYRVLSVRTADGVKAISQVSAENPFKQMKDALITKVVPFVHTLNEMVDISAMANMLSVNFEGYKTTKTMMYKTCPGLLPDTGVNETNSSLFNDLGINYYTTFGSSPMLAEGRTPSGRYFDEIHFLDWLVDAVQKNIFNSQYQNPTKTALTDEGVTVLLNRINEVAEKGVRNGGAAPGVWRIDGFGMLRRGDYLPKGYYSWADPVALLSDTEVDERKAPLMYLAIKSAGAIHKSETIIAFSR